MHNFVSTLCEQYCASTLYQLLLNVLGKVDTELIQKWFIVDTNMIHNFVSSLYQLCINLVSTQLCVNFVSPLIWNWDRVDAKLIHNFVSTFIYSVVYQLSSAFMELIQSWYKVVHQLCYNTVTTPCQLCVEFHGKFMHNCVSTLYQIYIKFLLKLIHNRVETKLMQSGYEVHTKWCINFVSTVYQFLIKVDTKFVHKWVGTKLLQSWYKVFHKVVYQLCINSVLTLHHICTNFYEKLIQSCISNWWKVVASFLHQLCINCVSISTLRGV